MKFSILLALLSLSVISCTRKGAHKDPEGKPVTKEFVKTFTGKFGAKESGETLTVNPDGTFSRSSVRQVSADGTVCDITEEGIIKSVVQRDPGARARHTREADLVLRVVITKTTLNPDREQKTPENCAAFAAQPQGKNQAIYAKYLGNKDSLRLQASGAVDAKNTTLVREVK